MGVGVGVAVGVGVGVGVEVGVGIGEGVGVGVGTATVIAGLGETLSENDRLWCELVAFAVNNSESDPADTPVIVHETVTEPPGPIEPPLTVGVLTEKRPFAELSVADEEAKLLLRASVPTVFSKVTVTVAL